MISRQCDRHGVRFDTAKPELREAIAAYYDRTYAYLAEISRTESGASPVQIWPHHFDMAVLISLPTPEGEEARSIGVGLSPGDGTISEPYWYITPYPEPTSDRLTPLPKGTWKMEGWVGALLIATELGDIHDSQNQQALQSGTAPSVQRFRPSSKTA
ncbi:MAG: hypothetical protein HC925_06385 [Coleofasciculaceae cyanobacterium SM2_3_26]|nr:hypothetical protein [Coleofasciculaceae cyanobacterium SM2_3_26]